MVDMDDYKILGVKREASFAEDDNFSEKLRLAAENEMLRTELADVQKQLQAALAAIANKQLQPLLLDQVPQPSQPSQILQPLPPNQVSQPPLPNPVSQPPLPNPVSQPPLPHQVSQILQPLPNPQHPSSCASANQVQKGNNNVQLKQKTARWARGGRGRSNRGGRGRNTIFIRM